MMVERLKANCLTIRSVAAGDKVSINERTGLFIVHPRGRRKSFTDMCASACGGAARGEAAGDTVAGLNTLCDDLQQASRCGEDVSDSIVFAAEGVAALANTYQDDSMTQSRLLVILSRLGALLIK